MLVDTAKQDIIGRIESLPTLPVVMTQLLALINNPKSNMSQISLVISRDQAIASRVVRMVNSAYYGLPTRVTSIQHAIVILGLNTVKNLTLGASVVKTFNESNNHASLFNRELFWLHCFSTAMCSQLLAAHLKKNQPEDYFLAGLLHDIGILIEDQFLHEDFKNILAYGKEKKCGLPEAEMAVLGCTHCEIGALVAEKWKIPSFLHAVLKHHHQPLFLPQDALPVSDLILLTHIADGIVRQNGLGEFFTGWKTSFLPGTPNRLELSPDAIQSIFSRVVVEAKSLMTEWGL